MNRSDYYGFRSNYRRLLRDARRADSHPYPQDPSQREARAAVSLFLDCHAPRDRAAILAYRPVDRYAEGGTFPRAYDRLAQQLDARDWKLSRGHRPAPIPAHFLRAPA